MSTLQVATFCERIRSASTSGSIAWGTLSGQEQFLLLDWTIDDTIINSFLGMGLIPAACCLRLIYLPFR